MQVKGGSVQEAVYRSLKEAIMTIQLEPGTTISTQEMAERLGVSRTPVREAFIRLERDGLLDIVPQKATHVSLINLIRAKEERLIRESLELAVMEPLLENMSDHAARRLNENLRRQRHYMEESDYVNFLEEDKNFHKIFFETANMMLMWDTIQTVNSHYDRHRILAIREAQTFKSTIDQHEVLMQLVMAGRLEPLQAELKAHLRKMIVESERLLETYPTYFDEKQKTRRFHIGKL